MKRLEQLFRLILIISLGCLVLVTLWKPLHINWDVSMYTEVGRRILEGQLPYVDYFEINFPVIHYLHTIPAALALLTGINELTTTLLCVGALCFWSTLICSRLGRHLFTGNLAAGRYLIPISIAMYSNWWFLLPPQYGQREHLFLLLFMPAFLLRIVHWQPAPSPTSSVGDFALGVLAGIAVCIKPYFLLFPIVIELYGLVFVHRSYRNFLHKEVLGFVFFGVIHIIYFLIFPDVLSGLLEMVPLIQRGYSAYGGIKNYSELPKLFTNTIAWRSTLTLALVLLVCLRQQDKVAILAKAMSLFGITAVIVYIIQGRGFVYHRQIFEVLEIATLSILILKAIEATVNPTSLHFPFIGKLKPVYKRIFRTVILIVVIVLSVSSMVPLISAWFYLDIIQPYNNAILRIIEANTQPDEGVMVIEVGLNLNNYPHLQQINRRQSASHVVAFPYAMGMVANAPDALTKWVDVLEQDIQVQQPNVIVMNTRIVDYLDSIGFLDNNIRTDYTSVYESDTQIVYRRNAAP